jgi:hypothetical protein
VPANPVAQELINLFKSLVWDAWVKIAVSRILSTLALSATGPIGWLVTTAVTKIADQLFQVIVMLADITTIKLKNAVHQAQFDSASEKLGIIFSEYGPESQEYKDAHDKEKAAFFNLITIKLDPLGINSK